MNGAGLVQEAATDAYNGDADGYGHRCPAPTKDAAVEEQTEPVDFSCGPSSDVVDYEAASKSAAAAAAAVGRSHLKRISRSLQS